MEDSRTALSPDGGGSSNELSEWRDRVLLREDSTTKSEPERQWLDAMLPSAKTGPYDGKQGSVKGLDVPVDAPPSEGTK